MARWPFQARELREGAESGADFAAFIARDFARSQQLRELARFEPV
ncbi:hypothetical protein [Falsiroseomonas bella]|nr:hypothetical protein [Falsiroseomonas bella]